MKVRIMCHGGKFYGEFSNDGRIWEIIEKHKIVFKQGQSVLGVVDETRTHFDTVDEARLVANEFVSKLPKKIEEWEI